MDRKSNVAMVPFGDIEQLLQSAAGALGAKDEKAVADRIGYDRSYFRTMRASGQVRLAVRYALIGLLHELKHPTPKPVTYDFDELTDLFGCVQTARAATPALNCAQVKKLQAKIARQMMEVA